MGRESFGPADKRQAMLGPRALRRREQGQTITAHLARLERTVRPKVVEACRPLLLGNGMRGVVERFGAST